MGTFLITGLLFVMILNVIMFFIAFRLQTDKLTDITYSVSFFSLAVFAFIIGSGWESLGKIWITALIVLWAIRLGWYLLDRVTQLGKDERFDQIRVNKKRFFRFFFLQGFASWIVSLPALIRLNVPNPDGSLVLVEIIGIAIAAAGLYLETASDYSKSKFKKQPGNKSKLYTEGWYKYIRYPNYLGESIFWIGIFVASVPYLNGLQYLSVLGTIFIIYLLVFVSGIPFLEKGRAKRLKGDPSYQEYLARTKKIIPWVY
jgi:steroid 5-alpha reductase family enzyme